VIIRCGGLQHIGQGILEPWGNAIIGTMGDDSRDAGERNESLGQRGETLRMTEEISRSHHHVGVHITQLSNPRDSAAMPRSQVDIAEVQEANRFASGIKKGQSFPAERESLALHKRAVGEGTKCEGSDTSKGEP
jgi:hypothetical protein